MKGLLKLSTVALSAAMVAGMSTPVFAAGANVGGTTTTATTIEVTDANGNVVATTKEGAKYYNFAGDTAYTNTKGTDGTLPAETLTVNLEEGSVKNLTATASDGSAVKWAYDEDAQNVKTAKEAVTLDNGKITVKKDANSGDTYDLLAYTDKSLNKDKGAKEGSLNPNSYVKVQVVVKGTTAPTITYVNGDSTYLDSDFNKFGGIKAFAANDPNFKEKTLPEVTHSSAEMKKASTEINHVATGSSAAFTIATGDDADYNTLVTYDDAPKGLTVETTSNTLEGTVSVTGNIANRFGVAKFTAKVDDSQSSEPLYVIADASSNVNVYRVYNPNTGEHFYTTSAEEADTLDKIGWDLEAIGWVAPSTGKEVYRLYNENAGEHHYTTSEKEKNALVAAGWKYEGVAFYSASKEYTRIYREYNKNAVAFNHNYTASKAENDQLVEYGWKYEGVAFYALSSDFAEDATTAAKEARTAVNAALKA